MSPWLCWMLAENGVWHPAGTKVRIVPPDELTLTQILQRMMGYNVVAIVNQFVTCAAFPGASAATHSLHDIAPTQDLTGAGSPARAQAAEVASEADRLTIAMPVQASPLLSARSGTMLLLLPATPTQPWAASLVCISPRQGELYLATRHNHAHCHSAKGRYRLVCV